MAFEIVDGMTGTKHIDSDDMTALNEALWGTGDCVMKTSSNFLLTMSSANKAVLEAGVGMVNGKRFRNSAAVTLTVDSGTQGQKRNDIVVARYAKTSAGIESVTPVVVKGTPTTGTPSDPAVTSNDLKLWRIPINGVSVGTPVRLFSEFPTLSDMADSNEATSSTSRKSEGGVLILEAAKDRSWIALRGKMYWSSFSSAWSNMVQVPGNDNGNNWYIDTGLNIGFNPGETKRFDCVGFWAGASSISPSNVNSPCAIVDGNGEVYIGEWDSTLGSVPFVIMAFGTRLYL